MMKSKKWLTAAVLAAVANLSLAGIAGAEALEKHQMSEMVVEGAAVKDDAPVALPGGFANETAATGLMGREDVMAAPMTITEISQQSIQMFSSPYNGITEALSLDPSVRADRGGTYTDISIRGIYQSGHSFYVNGIPGLLCQENIPYNWVESVSVISGPNLGKNATTLSEAAAGVVNITPKVAPEEGVSKFKISYRGGASMQEEIDVGGRFGKDKRYGVRFNASNINGNTAIDGENVEQQSFAVNVDQKGSRSKSNLLIAYDHTDHKGGNGAISFDGSLTSLPSAPKADRNYKPDWAYNEYDNVIIGLNHEQKINDHLSAYLNFGYHREDWYGYIDGNPTVKDLLGNYTISMTNYPLASTKKFVGIGVKGDFKLGSVKNEYLIGGDKSWQTYDLSKNPDFATGGTWSSTGNLYKKNWWPSLDRTSYVAKHNSDTRMTGWHIVDNIKALDDKLNITLGLHGHEVVKTPDGKAAQTSRAICPTFAASYRITPSLSVFADHSESFGTGAAVGAGYENTGEILDPTKTKMNEVGFKYKTGSFLHGISAFHIKQANGVDKTIDGKKYRTIDGRQTNKGFEYSFSGKVGKKWDLVGGFMYLNSKDNKGDKVNGAAELSGTLGMVYHPTKDWSVIGRVTYMDDTTIAGGKLAVPSATKWDLGASYKTKIHNTPVTFDMMVYNLFDKQYWSARSGSNNLSVAAPRTLVVSATFDL